MIVRGHSQGPTSQTLVVLLEELCGRSGRSHGVIPFIHTVRNSQELGPRPAHKLPDPARPHVGARVEVETALNEGKAGQFKGESCGRKFLFHQG